MVKFQPENKPGIIHRGWMDGCLYLSLSGSETQDRGLIVLCLGGDPEAQPELGARKKTTEWDNRAQSLKDKLQG